jgi:chromosomal replication initiation ATPase DnaA
MYIGEYNQASVKTLQMVLQNPESYLPINIFYIYGEGGVGKTTLLKAFLNEANVVIPLEKIHYFTSDQFENLLESDNFENLKNSKIIILDSFPLCQDTCRHQ